MPMALLRSLLRSLLRPVRVVNMGVAYLPVAKLYLTHATGIQCPFHSLISVMFFVFLHILFVILLFEITPKCST